MAKGRLAPTSTISIPRLELQSAVLAARLTKTIKKELRIHISSVEYYSDSMIVIKQLLSSHLERPMFVKGRLDEILRHSKKKEWSHIDGKDNVADDGVTNDNRINTRKRDERLAQSTVFYTTKLGYKRARKE